MPYDYTPGDRVALQDWLPARDDRVGTVDCIDAEGAVWVRWDQPSGEASERQRYPRRALKPASE